MTLNPNANGRDLEHDNQHDETQEATSGAEERRHDDVEVSHWKLLLARHSRLVNAIAFYCMMMLLFIGMEPNVFLKTRIYTAVFTTVPFLIIMVIPAVFVIVGGELDLSFPAVFAASSGVFTYCVVHDFPAVVAVLAAILLGAFIGALNGLLVLRLGLSSLVTTLGMNFLLRGIIFVVSDGRSISMAQIRGTNLESVFIGEIGSFPGQMLWALGLAGVGIVLFTRHQFGVHIRCVGDNPQAAREMGINVVRVRTLAFMYMGVSAGFAGVLSSLALTTWFPGSGDGYLLLVLAAVFVGGTPTWGGVGTVAGGAVGALVIGFAESGILSIGLSGFYTQLFFGLIIILSLAGQRLLPGASRRQ